MREHLCRGRAHLDHGPNAEPALDGFPRARSTFLRDVGVFPYMA